MIATLRRAGSRLSACLSSCTLAVLAACGGGGDGGGASNSPTLFSASDSAHQTATIQAAADTLANAVLTALFMTVSRSFVETPAGSYPCAAASDTLAVSRVDNTPGAGSALEAGDDIVVQMPSGQCGRGGIGILIGSWRGKVGTVSGDPAASGLYSLETSSQVDMKAVLPLGGGLPALFGSPASAATPDAALNFSFSRSATGTSTRLVGARFLQGRLPVTDQRSITQADLSLDGEFASTSAALSGRFTQTAVSPAGAPALAVMIVSPLQFAADGSLAGGQLRVDAPDGSSLTTRFTGPNALVVSVKERNSDAGTTLFNGSIDSLIGQL